MDPVAIGAIAGAVSVPVAFAVFRRVLPNPGTPNLGRSLESLRGEYAKWELATVLLLFIFAPAATFAIWQAFLLFAAPVPFSMDGDQFTLKAAPVVWLFPAMALGLLAAGPLSELVLRCLLGGRYGELLAYQSLRHGFRVEVLEKPLYLGLGGVGVGLAAAIANWHIEFSPTEMRWNRFWSLREQILPYSEISAIKTAPAFVAPNGRTVSRRERVIQFHSAHAWSTLSDPSEATEAQLEHLFRSVSDWSGVPIEDVALLTRDDLR